MQKTRELKEWSVGDAAVEGLLNGILAGVVMAVFVVVAELVAGVDPLIVLGYFDAGGSGSPLVGVFTHIAISGIYGVAFGFAVVLCTRLVGTRMDVRLWLLLGLVYGLLILGVAEWVVLPRTGSSLRDLPVWVFGVAHGLYGLVLGWLAGRIK